MMLRILRLLPVFAIALTFGQGIGLIPDDNAAHITRTLVSMMPQAHMNHEPLSETIGRRTLDNFLRALDYDRSMFMASDILDFRRRGASIQEELREGNLALAFHIFSVFRERAANRVAFVKQLLEEGFDLEAEQEFAWRRKDAPWAVDEAEWDDLWRKKVQNEFVGHMVSRHMRELEAAEKKENEAEAEAAVEEAALEETPGEEAVEVLITEESPAAEEVEIVEVPESPAARVADLTPSESIRRRYVQFLEVINGHDAEYVQQMFLSSFTRAYDTHSSYMSPRANEDFDINMRLSLTGIGAILNYEEGAAKIERLMKGGPAQRDGRLKPGDRIVAVGQGDGEAVDILFWPLYRSVRLIRGEIGTTVVLHVIPASDPTGSEIRIIDIVRDEIKLEENAAKSIVHEVVREDRIFRLGILHLPDFYRDFNGDRSSAVDVRALLEEFNEQNVDGMVLDLRNNGGGSLQDAVEMSGYFIDAGPIVQVRSERAVRALSDPRRGVVFGKPLVVLVNRLSASASEILAAALQDYGRAVIVGDSKTHGKGSVQSIIPLDRRDGSLGTMKVTTAAFYRVDGRSTQLKGVSPDIEIRSPSDVMELGEEFLDNVLPWTWVPPSRFMPYGTLREVNEQLRDRAAARLAADEDFATFQQKIDRLAERVQRRQVSLRLEDRLTQAMADRELDRLQEDGLILEVENGEEDAGEDENGREIRPDTDLVLRESLNILADLIELSAP